MFRRYAFVSVPADNVKIAQAVDDLLEQLRAACGVKSVPAIDTQSDDEDDDDDDEQTDRMVYHVF